MKTKKEIIERFRHLEKLQNKNQFQNGYFSAIRWVLNSNEYYEELSPKDLKI